MDPEGFFNKIFLTFQALQDYGIVLLLGDDLKLKVLVNRGLLYFDRKDYKNALHDFQMAAQISPDDKKIHHTLALSLHKLVNNKNKNKKSNWPKCLRFVINFV